jgi:hypothetical protein
MEKLIKTCCDRSGNQQDYVRKQTPGQELLFMLTVMAVLFRTFVSAVIPES